MVLDIKKTVADDACALTRAVLQMFAMLDLYQAELARILRLKCGEAGELAAAQRELEPAGEAWEQALLLVRFYRALYVKKMATGWSCGTGCGRTPGAGWRAARVNSR